MVAVIDSPSDRKGPPDLGGFRKKLKHVANVKAVIVWLHEQSSVPVMARAVTELCGPDGPDGIILISTMRLRPG